MSADYADLRVGTRVKGMGAVGTVVAVWADGWVGVRNDGDTDYRPLAYRPHELTILPAEDVPPSDDAGGETEGRVERSTGTTTPAPCPSAADVIAAADDFLRVAQEQQDHYDNRRPLHGDAMEDLVRERFEALRAAVRAFP